MRSTNDSRMRNDMRSMNYAKQISVKMLYLTVGLIEEGILAELFLYGCAIGMAKHRLFLNPNLMQKLTNPQKNLERNL